MTNLTAENIRRVLDIYDTFPVDLQEKFLNELLENQDKKEKWDKYAWEDMQRDYKNLIQQNKELKDKAENSKYIIKESNDQLKDKNNRIETLESQVKLLQKENKILMKGTEKLGIDLFEQGKRND